jgi:hypothetical protein
MFTLVNAQRLLFVIVKVVVTSFQTSQLDDSDFETSNGITFISTQVKGKLVKSLDAIILSGKFVVQV